ncbi:23S rRNA (adenine(2030)-N(6))-methyltransferase RlmJ [Aquabacterium sp. OR-4]|uniref:23S rRNA (adenine(2030)-N(6))-methyltransferase RlmJ n=1 Tax=Aquabacterium sp. OR-4 TaxID=2978127 RepID=UPI0021B35E7D|nr:23S rRNA (adenine(2030)-N(6))-methyltransferase RlmJ [Aquabacterium sp. OR-4]MDT7835651.1 23S rRNA (adenine(2030)-N(6))-methyltransferase RlmJ [Aquabacterium sp. OR-4]
MLAYRHAFHAGNHADVLKHATLVAVLNHMNQKDKTWRLVDTHAGAGGYALQAPQSQKLAEHQQGVVRVLEGKRLPPLLADYVAQIRAGNPPGELQFYPGSPRITRGMMRPQDQLRLFELHPTDHALLAQAFEGDRQVAVAKEDGFNGLKGQLPPSSRRGVLLIDPSYEIKTDYAQVVSACRDALARFAECVILVWYPQLTLRESAQLPQRLKAVAKEQAKKGWLHARLTVAQPDERGYGMQGSGMFVINPPHTLKPLLGEALPVLVKLLGQFDGAASQLEMAHGL